MGIEAQSSRDIALKLVILFGAAQLVLLESLSHLEGAGEVSVSGWATITWLLAWTVSQPRSLMGWAIGASLLLIGLISVLVSGENVTNTGYYLLLTASIVSFFSPMAPKFLRYTRLTFFYAALISILILSASLVVSELAGRASQVAAPLSALCVLCLRPGKFPVWLSTSFVITLLGSLMLDTARMSSALTMTILALWILVQQSPRALYRFFAACALVSGFTAYWLAAPNAYDRMFKGDAALGLGQVTLNTEGRLSSVRLIASEDETVWEMLRGSGVGSASGRLEAANFVLDNPHSEFVRLWNDLGVTGLALLVIVVGTLLFLAAKAFRKQDTNDALLLVGIAIIFLGFSLTDNILSYVWVMAPSVVLVTWVLGAQQHNHAQCDSDLLRKS